MLLAEGEVDDLLFALRQRQSEAFNTFLRNPSEKGQIIAREEYRRLGLLINKIDKADFVSALSEGEHVPLSDPVPDPHSPTNQRRIS